MSDDTAPPSDFDISSVLIEDEMRQSYLAYAMSVIVSRALPDVRDGLKPVHRRILYTMKENGYDSTKPYRKSARIVGDVMGKYHPHGDSAIYDAMVRMAQSFSLRVPLVDGQGNFGSMDGDAAAAMRYTEARLSKAAETMLDDIDKDTVDFQPNYDESETEPSVLPARFPALLVNGGGGIAVGMATNIPPHNLGEVLDACIAYVDNPDITMEELMEIVPGPDFPTGGEILGRSGIRAAYATGRGSVIMRSKVDIEEIGKDRQALIVTEIPYQVNKSRMLERIAEVVREKQVEGVGDLRDESDRDGVRVVIELKRGVEAEVVKAQLFRHTPLQTSFGVNMLALHDGQPKTLSLKDIIGAFVYFREEVIKRRTAFELAKARDRAHILAGLMIAIMNIDPVIELIRRAPDPQSARDALMSKAWPATEILPYLELIDDPESRVEGENAWLSERQARAILDLRLQRLTGMEREKLEAEARDIQVQITDYLEILGSRPRRMEVLTDELKDIRDRFADPRRTVILENEFEHDIEDLIQREDMVVTVTHGGYIKRTPLATYRAQRRGGKGRTGMSMKDEDAVSSVFVTSTHTPVLFFSSRGMVYMMKVYRLPAGTPQSRGKAMVNVLPLEKDEWITTVMPLPEDEASWSELDAVFATMTGNIRRNKLSDFTNVKANGKIAMKLDDGDRLVSVSVCSDDQDILLSTQQGKCIRFEVGAVRVFSGRTSTGVRGIKLAKGDQVIGMSILRHSDHTPEDRDDYLRAQAAAKRLTSGEYSNGEDRVRDEERAAMLEQDKFAEMAEREEFILTVSDRGMGQLASAYDYRVTGRGGQGINNMDLRGANVAAAFLFDPALDELMMVSDAGQIIRIHGAGISWRRRGGKGVIVFDVGNDQKVVSVARLREDSEADDDDTVEGTDEAGTPAEEVGAGEAVSSGSDESGL
ncbi:DNA gyrase subunit A [Pacificispira sp.]|uniref:DNA gyrase subunit A n=1 Tax=Pacificispira sp. TaxID=2888761 RepID=UPI003B522BED